MKLKLVATAALAAVVALPAAAADVKLPKQVSWTAYGTTSSGYAQSVGLGGMLKKQYGTNLRIIPGKNDVSRMLPLRTGQIDICACGIAAYFGQEGVMMFANANWGPVPLYNLFNNIGRNGLQAVVAGDVGIKTVADLKGKRVTWVKGSPALVTNMTAYLAFGGLTWDDVVKVEVPGWKQSADALINGQADAAIGSTVSSAYNQLAASPRGLFWTTLPHDDKEAWARSQAVAPFWAPAMVSNAIAAENNTSGKVPFEGMNYPYPIFVSLEKFSQESAYGLTKAIMENYDDFKESGPSMDGYQLKNQNFTYVFPYHPGSIQYYKEAGVWTAEAQANTDALLKRQKVLADAWAGFDKKKNAGDGFEAAWLKVRADALEAAGMNVPFRDPS